MGVKTQEEVKGSGRDSVVQATVTLWKEKGVEGRGVLVGGNMILTAAHCINYSCEAEMALGDPFVVEIKSQKGTLLKVDTLAVEPCMDIAVLCSLDPEEFYQEAGDFEEFCEDTTAIPIFQGELESGFPIHIYTRENKWLTGKASCPPSTPMLWYETKKPVKGGTSGSPIVNDSGEVVGIVSVNSNHLDGHGPVPHLALPVWVCSLIERGWSSQPKEE